jgi:hypothetical protein
MGARKAAAEPLRFRGTPGSLSAALAEGEITARRLPIRLAVSGKRAAQQPLTARATRLEGDLVLQLTLPARTPPGTYEGTAEVDGDERPIVVEVEPEIELEVVPDQLTIEASPGEHVAVALTIVNAGNVAVEIRRAYAFGIFAAGGLERALHRAYTSKRPEGERRVDFLFDQLADEHGGVVRVAIEEGSGELKPGEARAARVRFHVPPDLHRGRTYTGTLPLYDVRYYVRLVVPDGKEPPADGLR